MRTQQIAQWVGAGVGTLMVLAGHAAAAGTTGTGPSTTTAPYVLPAADDVTVTSLLTVGDGGADNGYVMVGIPDGLGASAGSRGTMTVRMNHELNATAGVTRRHGQTGAFVSEWQIDAATNRVRRGRDLIGPRVMYWDYLRSAWAGAPNAAGTQEDGDVFPAYDARFGRFCSGSLTAPNALYDRASLRGYRGQLWFANEETGNEGRLFAVEKNGRAWQLPRLGLFSWENTLLAPTTTETTLVMGNEDGGSGQLWVYVGTKQKTGTAPAKAGLTNGTSYVVDLVNEAVSTDAGFRATVGKGTPAAFDLAVVDWDRSGADQNAAAAAAGLSLNRIEDGAFDPQHPNDFYFVTTAGGNGPGGGVWRLHWNDLENPLAGGSLTLLLDGSEGLVSPDNVAIDGHGNLLIQEDPGNNPHLARILAYRIADGVLGVVAQFDPALFTAGQPGFLTQDEESSGIIDAEAVTGVPGSFLFDAQVHAAPASDAAALVERGQLLRLQIDDWAAVYGAQPE